MVKSKIYDRVKWNQQELCLGYCSEQESSLTLSSFSLYLGQTDDGRISVLLLLKEMRSFS